MLSSISRLLLCLLLPVAAFAQDADTTVPERAPAAELANGRQLRLGFDISRPLLNAVYKNRTGYELMLDLYLRKEMYLVAEGGWGNSDIDYDNLKHSNRLEDSFFIVGYLSNTNKYIGSGSKIQALLKIILALILTSPGI